MTEIVLNVELYAGLDRDGSILLIAEVGSTDHVIIEKLDLQELLDRQPGHYVCGQPLAYPRKKDRREVEVMINNFERAAKRAIKAGRKATNRFAIRRKLDGA